MERKNFGQNHMSIFVTVEIFMSLKHFLKSNFWAISRSVLARARRPPNRSGIIKIRPPAGWEDVNAMSRVWDRWVSRDTLFRGGVSRASVRPVLRYRQGWARWPGFSNSYIDLICSRITFSYVSFRGGCPGPNEWVVSSYHHRLLSRV